MRHRALDPAAAWRWQGLGAPGGVGEGEELVWMLKGEEVVQQPLKLIWSKVEEDGLVRRVERLEASFEQSEGVGAPLRDTTALFAALLSNGDAARFAAPLPDATSPLAALLSDPLHAIQAPVR